MNLNYLFGFSGVIFFSILCNGIFTNRFITNISHLGGNVRDSSSKRVREILRYKDVPSRMPLKRNERSVNKSDPDTASRVVESDDSKNSSSASFNKTVFEHALLVSEFKRLWPVWRWREYGYFHDDYLDLINEHWLQFPPPSETVQKTLGCLYLLFATVGCWGNVVVLFMYISFRSSINVAVRIEIDSNGDIENSMAR